MKGYNAVTKMTEAELRRKLWGTPKHRAKMVGSGFARHWEYRGVAIHSRKNAGWSSGSTWWSDPINGQSYQAAFKDVLMAKIDKAIDKK